MLLTSSQVVSLLTSLLPHLLLLHLYRVTVNLRMQKKLDQKEILKWNRMFHKLNNYRTIAVFQNDSKWRSLRRKCKRNMWLWNLCRNRNDCVLSTHWKKKASRITSESFNKLSRNIATMRISSSTRIKRAVLRTSYACLSLFFLRWFSSITKRWWHLDSARMKMVLQLQVLLLQVDLLLLIAGNVP